MVTTRATTELPARPRLRRALTVPAAGLAGLAVWAVTVPFGVELRYAAPDGTTGEVLPVAVPAAGLISALLGWSVLAVLERFTRRPRRTWTVLALVVLVASLGGPVIQAQNVGAAMTLSAMHLVVGAVTILALARTSREPASERKS